MITFNEEGKKREVNGSANKSRCHVRYEQSLGLLTTILSGRSQDTLIKVSCLEKEEGHEVIRPLHHFLPPCIFGMTAEVHDMLANHADDADAAQEVESMVSWFHYTH